MRIPLLLSLLLAAAASPALASSSEWHETTGGAIRLVTTGLPDSAGKLKGVLQIRLEPGWKTYWRDPGSSGVPPTLDIGDAGTVAMEFPAPDWHNDGQFDWAGYTQSVSLPVTLTLNRSGPLDAKAFIGICETICVPLQADLTLDPASDPNNQQDVDAVKEAEASLPAGPSADFSISAGQPSGDDLTLTAALPSTDGAELFLAGNNGYQFGKPRLVEQDGKPAFRVRVISRPKTVPTGEGLHYTLLTAQGAVSGVIPYF